MKFEINRGFIVTTGYKGDWRWRLKSSNGRIVAEGGEGYKRAPDMVRSIRKYVVRFDLDMSQALKEALQRAGLDEWGRTIKRER